MASAQHDWIFLIPSWLAAPIGCALYFLKYTDNASSHVLLMSSVLNISSWYNFLLHMAHDFILGYLNVLK